MAEKDMILIMRSLVGDIPEYTDELAKVYLTLAGDRILRRLYPFGTTATQVPDQYQVTQCELASRMMLRIGAEGETAHNENGINRTYGSVNDEDIMARITPYAEVL